MFPGANPSTPAETRRQPGRRTKGRRPGPNGRGTHTAPPFLARPNQKSRFRFRQNAASRHVSDLSSPGRHHSDRLAGRLTLFRVPHRRRGLASYSFRLYATIACKICQEHFRRARAAVPMLFSRSAAAAFWTARLRWPGTRPGIDLLSYMATRRFVFPQTGSGNGGKLPGKEQPPGDFFLGRRGPLQAGFSAFASGKRGNSSFFPDNPALFLPERRSGPHPFWSFRRIFKIHRKTRKKVPHGGILHLLFCRGFVMIKALYCEKCDNTTIARSSI